MQKTTLMKAIAQTDLLRRTAEDLYKLGKGCAYNELAQHHMATIVRLQSLLPAEQAIIMESYKAGQHNVAEHTEHYKSPSDYYLTTFTAPDGDKSKEK